MNRFRPLPAPRKRHPEPAQRGPRDVIRRFFTLMERFERPRRSEPHEHGQEHAPETKARITRLDGDPSRSS